MFNSGDSVLVAGHICVDMAPVLGEDPRFDPGELADVGALSVRLGGCVANTGRALAALGIPVRGSALIGDDALSRLTLSLAAQEPFGTDQLFTVQNESTSYSIVLEPPGQDRMFWHHAGVNSLFDGRDVNLDGVAILHVGYPSLLAALRNGHGARLAQLFQRARDRSIVTSLDLAVASGYASDAWGSFFDTVLPLTDIISPSIEDLRSVASTVDESWQRITPREAAQDLVARGAAVALVTAGPDGLHMATADRSRISAAGAALNTLADWNDVLISVEAAPTPRRVTTNGAGDAASAGLLAGIWRGLSARGAAELATSTAGRALAGHLLVAPVRSAKGVQ